MQINKIKNIILSLTILILTTFVTVYGINTFYERPEYEDFCKNEISQKLIQTEKECIDSEGKWNPQEIRCVTDPCPEGYCDITFNCRQDYQDRREEWTKNVFIIAVPLGIVIIASSAFLIILEPVATGLMIGGIFTLLYGTWGFFFQTNDKIRFIISLIGLAVVIALAYYFNKKFEEKSKKKKEIRKK